MSNISLRVSSISLDQLFPDQTNYNVSTNASLMSSCNMSGIHPCFPTIAPAPTLLGNYQLLYFDGLGQVGTTTFAHRTLQPSSSPLSNLSNSWYVTYAGNYRVIAYTSACSVYKNGSLVASITTLRGVASINSLVIGDLITVTTPAAFNHFSNPGLIGAYCGYAGYSFANRVDRYSVKIYIFNVSSKTSNYNIGRSTTSDANLTSLTSVSSGTIAAGGYIAYTVTTFGNYFIYNSQLSVVWRGQAPSNDCMTVYPMSTETKYGWFSSDGHTLATNNGEANRNNSGGGNTILGRTTANNVVNIISSLGTGQSNAYASDGVSNTLKGGSYFSGNGCAVYNNGASSATGEGIIYSAESQADGNGGEMTAFTGIAAHARGSLSGGGAAWVAAIGAGFSGSTPSYPLYADVIMRFNSSGVFQNAKSFSGQNTSTPHSKKAYWGNGSGTGTEFSPGDFFWSTVAVQGFQDTDASDKDESNMVMSNTITLPSRTSYLIYGSSAFEGFSDPTVACESRGTPFEVDSPSANFPNNGVVVFLQDTTLYNHPFNGQNLYFFYMLGRTKYTFQVGYNGILSNVSSC